MTIPVLDRRASLEQVAPRRGAAPDGGAAPHRGAAPDRRAPRSRRRKLLGAIALLVFVVVAIVCTQSIADAAEQSGPLVPSQVVGELDLATPGLAGPPGGLPLLGLGTLES
jgi:hypothetical protein